MLIDCFCCGVAPAGNRGRAKHAIVVFRHWHLGSFSVDLTGGCQEQFAVMFDTGSDHILGTFGVDHERTQGLFDDVANANRGGQMKHDVGISHQCVCDIGIQDGCFNELNVATHRGEVGQVARRQVVDHRHFMAEVNETVNEMRADVSGPAGY